MQIKKSSTFQDSIQIQALFKVCENHANPLIYKPTQTPKIHSLFRWLAHLFTRHPLTHKPTHATTTHSQTQSLTHKYTHKPTHSLINPSQSH